MNIKPSRVLLLLVFLLVIGMAGSAQESDDAENDVENHLLAMLARVPSTPEVRDMNAIVSYADYRAIEMARGIDTPTVNDFMERTELSALWIAATNGLSAGFPFQDVFTAFEEIETTVGFSWFDVDRSINFGNPPAQGNVLQGSFDADQVAAAYRGRGYTLFNYDGIGVWCSPDGCGQGMRTDMTNINRANPFGGRLGRSEPVALDGTYLYNAPAITVLEDIIAVVQDDRVSLAGVRDYSASARALASVGTVRQALFLHPLSFINAPPLPNSEGSEDVNSFEDVPALPPASLVVFGDTWQEDEQIVLIGLVYNNVDDATAALDVIEARIAVTTSLVRNMPYTELLEQRGMTISDKIIFEDEEAGRVVGLLEMRYPMPSNEPQEDSPRFIASGLGFRLLVDGIYQRDLSFLAVLE